MNKIYTKLYPERVFTLSQGLKIIKNKQVCKNTLNRLIKQNLIKRIRKPIYYIIPIDNQEFYPNKVHIASKLRDKGVLCCNTALHIHNLWKPENTIYIASKYAKTLKIKTDTYKILKNKQDIGIITLEYETGYTNIKVQVTDIERTLLDILLYRTIKLTDLINVLRTNTITLNMKKIIKYLEKYDKPILYNKTGLLLDAAKENLKITDKELQSIKEKLTKKVFYAKEKGLKLIKPKYKYYQKWNLMITEELYEILHAQTNKTVTNT